MSKKIIALFVAKIIFGVIMFLTGFHCGKECYKERLLESVADNNRLIWFCIEQKNVIQQLKAKEKEQEK